MDFVKREDQNLIDEENYKIYLESLQKSQQMESEYQHTAISLEQLHQAMQSSLSSSIVHNFQLPLSPRQMSTLMLKTNHLTRTFNEVPAHLPRNLSTDIDLAQNLTHEMPTLRHEDLVLSRNMDLSLVRNLSNDLESASLIQNLNEQELTRINNDLSRIVEMPHNLSNEIDLSHHLNRQNIEQEMLLESRRTPMVIHMQENQLLEQNLASNLVQRLPNPGLSLHESRHIGQSEHLQPMPFHIKAELEEEGYFYENINQSIGNVSGMNGHIPGQSDHQPTQNIHQDSQMYIYSNHIQNLPALNSVDLYPRPQYIQNYRENPQNLVVHRQFDNASPYQEELKKFRQDTNQNTPKIETKEQPKENLKPSNQNKLFYSAQTCADEKSDSDSLQNKLTEDLSLIKGEYVCYKCNNVFPSKRGLKQHSKNCAENCEANESDEKLGKFLCTQCSYRCQSPAILKIHERTHTGEKPFSCTFCDYKSGQKNNVAKHILVHMKEKPFRCQFCDYRCAQKNNLVVHERTHTGYKPFACPYCDYRTVQKPNLVKHMYLHTDQKPFSCDMCSYRCVQKTNLTKHKQRHLNEKDGEKVDVKSQTKPYRPRQKSVKCPYCSYRCVQKASLVKHLQFKHCGETSELVETSFDTVDEMCEESINLSVKKDFVEGKEALVQS